MSGHEWLLSCWESSQQEKGQNNLKERRWLCLLYMGWPGDWMRKSEDFSYGKYCYPLYNKRRKGIAGWHLCLSRRKLDQQIQVVTPEENPPWQVDRPQGLITLHLYTGHFPSAPLTAAHGLTRRRGQLTLEGEILSEGCSWGSGLQKHEGAGQQKARGWCGRRKGLDQRVMLSGTGEGQCRRCWVDTTGSW